MHGPSQEAETHYPFDFCGAESLSVSIGTGAPVSPMAGGASGNAPGPHGPTQALGTRDTEVGGTIAFQPRFAAGLPVARRIRC
jgi:hypothetical protein